MAFGCPYQDINLSCPPRSLQSITPRCRLLSNQGAGIFATTIADNRNVVGYAPTQTVPSYKTGYEVSGHGSNQSMIYHQVFCCTALQGLDGGLQANPVPFKASDVINIGKKSVSMRNSSRREPRDLGCAVYASPDVPNYFAGLLPITPIKLRSTNRLWRTCRLAVIGLVSCVRATDYTPRAILQTRTIAQSSVEQAGDSS